MCINYFQQRKTFAGACQGVLNQVQDGVRSPDGLNSDAAISCSLGSTTKAVWNQAARIWGWGCQRKKKEVYYEVTLVALNDRDRFARQGWPSWPKKLVPFPGGRLLVDRGGR